MNIPNVQFPNVNHLMHAYRVAPWRVQRQWIGNVLLAVVVLAMVAALYLNITSQTAVAGREIQDLNNAILISQQTSSDLHTQLASLTSATAMETRALALGFRPIESGEVEYLGCARVCDPAAYQPCQRVSPAIERVDHSA
jgi:hypothetical protein